MTTIDDLASAAEERIREAELHEHRRRAQKETLIACGVCYSCSAPVQSSHLFCDAGCRDDWQRRQDARRRNGN